MYTAHWQCNLPNSNFISLLSGLGMQLGSLDGPKDNSLLKVSHDGMSFEITKLMLIPVNNLCYLIKLLSLFPACDIYSPFIALSIFVVLSNFCRIIKLMPSLDIELFFLGINISLVISQDISSCDTFSRITTFRKATVSCSKVRVKTQTHTWISQILQ